MKAMERAGDPGTPASQRDSEKGLGVFCDGGARPPTEAMIAFMDDHRKEHWIEPICKVLPIAPSTYHDHESKRREPDRLSARARRDAELKVEVKRVFDSNFGVYGVRKLWRQLLREGFAVARCTVERLMRKMGLKGVTRGITVQTTVSDKAVPCPLDHVNRQFHAPAPNRNSAESGVHISRLEIILTAKQIKRTARCHHPSLPMMDTTNGHL